MMSVTGYLALYTTLLGWQQYQNLWNIAVGTGLIYLPFLGIILSSTVEPFTSMGSKDAAQIAMRRLTVNVLTAFLVIAFAAAPAVQLNPKVLHYAPVCQSNTQDATPGNTGTTYDDSFPVPTGVRVPIWWYLVMAFANGVTQAAITQLPCAPLDFRALHDQLDTSSIQDPQLKQEVSQFYQDCYVPAYSAYMGGQLNAQQQAQVKDSLNKNSNEDVGWIGSLTLLNVSGLYDSFNANKPVTGFAFDATRDVEEGQVPNHSPWGKPDCKTWWSDPENGLQKKLQQNLPTNFLGQLFSTGSDRQKLQDASLKTLLSHSFMPGHNLSDQLRGYESLNDNTTSPYGNLMGSVGTAYESLSFYPKMYLLRNALPIIQGILLFALYAFIGLAIPFSRYRIGFCVTGAVVIFSVIFCSYLWQMTQWFDNYLTETLYPSNGVFSAGVSAVFRDPTGTNQLFVDMIIGSMYIVLPILWMSVMTWAGIQSGHFFSNFIGSMIAPSVKAGEKGGNTITKRLP